MARRTPRAVVPVGEAHAGLDQPFFHDEPAAFAFIEAQLWPGGPACPHPACRSRPRRIGRLNKTRLALRDGERRRVVLVGLHRCYGCGGTFTVRKGTVFAGSRLPLQLWLQALHLLTSGRRTASTRELRRALGCSLKTAWGLTRRLRRDTVGEDRRGTRHPGKPDAAPQAQRFRDLAAALGAAGTAADLARAVKEVALRSSRAIRRQEAGETVRGRRSSADFTGSPPGQC